MEIDNLPVKTEGPFSMISWVDKIKTGSSGRKKRYLPRKSNKDIILATCAWQTNYEKPNVL